MRKVLASVAATVAVMGFAQIPAQADTITECMGTITGGTYDRIVVPAGATCHLDGVTVNGNVRIFAGSALVSNGSTINGSVRGDGARTVRLDDTDVIGTGTAGNINLQGTLRRIIIGASGCIVDPSVGNNITLINNFGNIGICEMTTGETIVLQGNDGLIGVHNNTIGNSLNVQDNTGAYTRIRDNEVGTTMGGSINIQDNRSQVVVLRNYSHNAFNCSGNIADPIGEANTADSGLSGQCALLG